MFSFLFWVFLVLSSVVLFPVAVLVWAVTAPFDRRLVGLHRFTCFWASLYTWLNPAWPVRGRKRAARSPRRALPKRGFVLQGRHDIVVRILDEIPYTSFADRPVEQVTDAVRQTIAAALGEERP